MDQEALEILKLVQEGRVTPEQGAKLLEALKAPPPAGGEPGKKARFVRVGVKVDDKVNVSMNLPIALADLALRLAEGAKIQRGDETIVLGDYVQKMSGMDMGTILQMVKEGAEGKLVDVDVGESDGTRVKVEVIVD